MKMACLAKVMNAAQWNQRRHGLLPSLLATPLHYYNNNPLQHNGDIPCLRTIHSTVEETESFVFGMLTMASIILYFLLSVFLHCDIYIKGRQVAVDQSSIIMILLVCRF